ANQRLGPTPDSPAATTRATTTCLICTNSLRVEAKTLDTPARLIPVDLRPTNTTIAPDLGGRDREQRRAPSDRAMSGQCKYRELAAERCVIPQGSIAADGAQAGGGIRQPGGKTDTGPAADAGQNRHVLLATIFIGGHVADDAGRRLELVEFLARFGVDGFEIAFERSVEHHAAGGRQGTRPDRELLRHRPDDLAGLAVPGNEIAHVAFAGRGIHR